MKKLFLLTKTLLVAVMLLAGTNAWADEWSLDFVALGNTYNQDKGAVALSASSVATIGGTDMRTITYNEGTAFNNNFVVGSNTTWLLRNSNRGLYMQVNGTRQIGCLSCTKDQTITIVTAGQTVTAATNVTLKSSGDNTYVFTVSADGDVKFNLANYGLVKSITVEDPSATAKNYTVKYVNKSGTEIKASATYQGEAGDDAVVYSTDKAKITYNDVNYCYESDDSEGKTIAADGSTVVTLTFHEAATYNYSINAKYGEEILNTIAGSSEEENAVTYCYNKYYNYNGTLVQKLANSNSYWVSFTPDADAYVKNDSYSLTEISNVVFFSEAEDIATLSARTSNYLSDRFSGGEGAFAESSDRVVATLPAGKYKLTAKIMGTYNAPSTFTFKAGEATIWESSTSTNTFYANGEITGDEFTLDSETNIVLVSNDGNGGGNSSKVRNLVDYFYIQQTGVAATISSYGKSTFSSTYPLDCANLPSGLKAYKATAADASKVTMVEVTDAVEGMTGSNKTGLVLVGTPSTTYYIPIATTDGSEPSGNLLFGWDSSWGNLGVAGSGTNFVLSVQDENVVWAPILDEENTAPLATGQAGLWANVTIDSGSGSARGLRMVFDGDVITGINEAAQVAEAAEKDGKFIINGQLVIKKNGKKFNAAGAQLY